MSGTSAYWPWWAIAGLLAAVTVGYWITARRLLGVSGLLGRFTALREELAVERYERVSARTQAAIEAELVAATREAFGDVPVNPAAGPSSGVQQLRARGRIPGPRLPLAVNTLFLAAIVVGGTLGAIARGVFHPALGLGRAHLAIFGGEWPSDLALLAGGAAVGFGAQLCGGCTAGHGLSGCSRLQLGSLVAVTSFLVGAIVTSLALGLFV